ncbi:hypothetical protein CLI70_04045 [Prevotella intermedia]|nr:hypothetical protein CLI70_04045 [Prevotella intermedia]
MKLYEKSYNLAVNMQNASLQCRLPATLGVCCFNSEVKLHLIYIGKEGNMYVNIFHKQNYHITTSLSTLCKTYCFAFQKRLFCTVKA